MVVYGNLMFKEKSISGQASWPCNTHFFSEQQNNLVKLIKF